MKNLRLKNTEISLAETLRFTPIPDKNNDLNFLTIPKTQFLGHFCLMGSFCKKSMSHTAIYGPKTPCQVSEKTNEQIPRKLTVRRKDGRTDPPYFIGLFRPRPRTQ